MSIKILKPNTPSSRGTVLVNRRNILWRGKPEKTLVKGKVASSGRNCYGRITVRHIGGGHKRKYRVVDFVRQAGSFVVQRIEYDPNRSTFIALLRNEITDVYSYILATASMKAGDKVMSGPDVELAEGNTLPLKKIPVGSLISNIELKPGKGGQIARSAGVSARLMSRDGKYVLIKFASGESRLILSECCATIGVMSNPDKKNIKLGKAGRKRWMGIRPVVRGVAMNPVDHPHGGGEGRTSGGRHPVTPWGFCTKGKKN